MKKKIEVSAPGKLMLFGEHAVVYDRPCIVTAVDHRMRVSVKLVSGNLVEINAPEVGVKDYRQKIDVLTSNENLPKGVRFVGTAVRKFFEKYNVASGLRIETKSDFSSEFGFGSSSAVTVSILVALSKLFEKKVTKRELFDLSYRTVLDVQGIGSGFDLAAAIWGGTVYFVTGGKEIIPLKIKELPLVVGFTGIKADTPTLVYQVANLHQNHQNLIDQIFDTITFLTEEARKVLMKSNMPKLGELMDINQGLLDALGVNTPELSNLISAARNEGALGAKLSGAGGGDCMIALVPKETREKIEQAIEKSKGKIISVKANAQGVRVEK